MGVDILPVIFPPIVALVMLVIIIVSFPVMFCPKTEVIAPEAAIATAAASIGRSKRIALLMLITSDCT